MSIFRAIPLTVSAIALYACADDGGPLVGPQPGQVTGACIQGQCLPGLMCFVDKCQPGPGGSPTSNSPPDDPTSGSDSTTGDMVTSSPTVTSGDPVHTTGEGSTTTTDAATDGTFTTEPPDPSDPDDTTWPGTSDDSAGFIMPDPNACGIYTCKDNEQCILVGQDYQCLGGCDPLSGGQCGPESVCAPADGGFVCAPDASGDLGVFGDPCEYANACDSGNLCVPSQFFAGCDTLGCCTMYCDLDLADPCIVYGKQCVPWFEPGDAPVGLQDVGYCGDA